MIRANKKKKLNPRQRPSGTSLTNIRTPQMARDTITVPLISSTVALSTNGSGLVIVTNLLNSLVTSLANQWADYAPRWQQYRILEMVLHFIPRFPVNTGMALNLGHSSLFLGDFIGANVPTTVAHIMADENGRYFSTAQKFVYTVTNRRNPNALLWAPTSAAVPVANTFGISIASSDLVNQLPLSIGIGHYFIAWKVQFTGYM